ncbi:hypothetical protein H8959_000738 [Pygathrix nigripes]
MSLPKDDGPIRAVSELHLANQRTKGPPAGKNQAVSCRSDCSVATMNGDDAFARRPIGLVLKIREDTKGEPFDDIAQYFSKKEWEKMKASEKIIYVYMKRKYEAMTKLVERSQMTFSMLQGIFPKIMPKKPAERKEMIREESARSIWPTERWETVVPPGKTKYL